MRKVYDLAGRENECRFSPFCWRVRTALAHKDLDAEFVPWRFTEKDRLAFSGQDRVPVLVDGDRTVSDSWAIMAYLDETYPERPLFDSPQSRAHGLFVKHWTETALHQAIFPIILLDIYRALRPEDQAYFRESREKALGRRLEDFEGDREARLTTLRRTLAPLRQTVKLQPFLGGAEPSGADHVVYGAFRWPQAVSDTRLLEPDDPVQGWLNRVTAAYRDRVRLAA